MVNKEYYQEYKGHTKCLSLIISLHFAKNNFFVMTLLHAHAQYIYIVCAKYQKASVKGLVQVDFTVYALSKHKQNPHLKAKMENMAKFTKLSFCPKNVFVIIILHANVQCVYIM